MSSESAAAAPRLVSAPLRYGLSVASLAAALLTTGLLERLFHTELLDRSVNGVALVYGAAVFSAWLGGIGPGLLAAVLGVLAVDYFVTPPLYALVLDIDYLPRLAVFGLSALLVGWLSVRRRRVEDALRRSHDELEARVDERTADLTRSNQQLHTEAAARKRAEETLREQAALLDLTHDTIFVRDVNDVITYWNRGAEELYGRTRNEAVGKSSHDLNQTVFPAPLEDITAELIRTGRWQGELIHTRRDGTKVVVASRWSLQRDDQGRPVATLETNNDITERKRAEEALQQAQAELAHVARVTTLGELAASIAHEINQPLAAIVADANACLNWLAVDRPDIDSVREALAAIVKDGDRAAEVIIRIRALLSRSSVAHEPCDLAGVIREVHPLVRPELGRHEITLEMSLATDVPAVLGDRIQLQQVLLNLIMNAAEAVREVPPQRRRLIVRSTVEDRDDGPWAIVAVEDAGVGFGEAEAARLFEAFYTTKPGGLGMGLAISRSIIDGHGGRLWATANVDHGVTFHFALPAMR
jgi:two-component system, LuxR family, sensor kinase FixL